MTKLISDKYKIYKNIEEKLLIIKDKISELKDWSKNTENLLKNFDGIDSSFLQNTSLILEYFQA